jgi:hypothetical protein
VTLTSHTFDKYHCLEKYQETLDPVNSYTYETNTKERISCDKRIAKILL